MPQVHEIAKRLRVAALVATRVAALVAALGLAPGAAPAALAQAPGPGPAPAPRLTGGGPVEVGTARAFPGQRARGALQVLETADGAPVPVPVTIVHGRAPGPIVWAQAGAHGDEYGAIRALQQMVRGLDPAEMSGAVVAVPVANPLAFRGLQRVNPDKDDLMDLGSSFTGRAKGFASERLAAAIQTAVRGRAGYFVDLHTGGDRFRQHPFILYTVTGAVPPGRMDDLARGFGLPTLWRDAVRIFPDDALIRLAADGIPAFLIEVGGGQPLQPDDLKLQAEALRNFLRAVGVLPGRPPRLPGYTIVDGYRIVTNDRGGFFDAAVRPGDRIREGSVLGTITDVLGETVETLRAPAATGIVLGVSTYPVAPTGGWLLELGTIAREEGAP